MLFDVNDKPPQYQVVFKNNVALLGIAILGVMLCCLLGFWQIDRAHQKQNILDEFHSQYQRETTTAIHDRDLKELEEYRKVRIKGRLINKAIWYLDNQTVSGKVGYDILSLFQFNNSAVLINFGWVPATEYRNQLPFIRLPEGKFELTGRLRKPMDVPFVSNILNSAGYVNTPSVIEVIPEQFFGVLPDSIQGISEYYIQISPEDNASYTTHWQSVNVTPQKHKGYALQWFLIALSICLLYVYYSSNFFSVLRSWLVLKR
ncbi:SURF1 family protein [Marinibactrum halimedae]|uniref:SURF1-like protein n=1 Tax=Marinibactrum halimedae TaxID=1444977 RepID=A0AA37T1M6_9GAMM|nr:SURF1 family protein [Marinibactrum halimedae]MCD9461051.1 SURF1 family protein [Marinibactrum halimedae]GLS24429.1 SURF1-like protein [Marinibactrum halimedae]